MRANDAVRRHEARREGVRFEARVRDMGLLLRVVGRGLVAERLLPRLAQMINI
jgi:hypothetical protein